MRNHFSRIIHQILEIQQIIIETLTRINSYPSCECFVYLQLHRRAFTPALQARKPYQYSPPKKCFSCFSIVFSLFFQMAKANSNFNFHPVFFQTQRCRDAEFFLSLEICCFRHLEKPIKTKENKIKPFVFICFYWFCSVFLDGESKQQVRLLCVFRVHVYINHRFQGSHR